MDTRMRKDILSYDQRPMKFKLFFTLVAACIASTSHAQSWPTKPVRLILAVPAGGTPDVVVRMITPGLSALLGQQLVVDNRGGAGGMIGAELAARATPDGYTLFFSAPGALTIVPHLQKKMPYDALRDFVPVSLVCSGPFLLVTHPSVQAKTVSELIAQAKTAPGKLNYGSAGNGAPNHLAMELLKNMAAVNITHVPYKGAPQTVTDVLGGNIQLTLNSIPPVIQHVKAGRLRLLGVSSAKRSPQLPEVPTIAEAGVPGYEFITWFGMLAPANTPKAIVSRLHESMLKVVHAPETKAQFEKLGYDTVGNSPDEFAAYLRAEHEKFGSIIKRISAKAD
jgi:tripartite-type tricarboxylate transporter receptor subunit TctC